MVNAGVNHGHSVVLYANIHKKVEVFSWSFFPDRMHLCKQNCTEMALNEGGKHRGCFKPLSCLNALDCFSTLCGLWRYSLSPWK